MNKRIGFILTGIFCTVILFAQSIKQKIEPGRYNSKEQEKKPYVILISADGFRYDYAQKFHAENLLRLSKKGITASEMIPCFPSLTFPNHYSIVTGLYPSHHGLVGNNFYDESKKTSYSLGNRKSVQDSSWYGGTPLWVLAEQQHMLTACFYWIGSEAAIKGIRPTYWYSYNESIKMDDRTATVKKWLQLPEEQRPHLITFYLPEVDHEGHNFGPLSKETEQAVHFVDESIGRMVASIDSLHLAVNYIFVSDHGMAQTDTVHGIPFPATIDTNQFIIARGGAIVQLYAKNKNDVMARYNKIKAAAKNYDVYLSEEMPGRWHYSNKDDYYHRTGDIILVAHLPYSFSFGNSRITPGSHGYDPAAKDMHATFMAWGPQLKQNRRIGSFENIHIYPVIAKMLGLSYTEKIDGNHSVLRKILK